MCAARLRAPAVTVLLVALGAGGAAPAEPAGADAWLEVPPVPAEGLEEAVARQLEGLRSLAVERVEDSDVGPAELAEVIGELGRHYHAYALSSAAADCYGIARRLAPGDFRWPYLLGYLRQGEGRLEEAAELYERAIEIVPAVPALIRLGRVYADLDRAVEAEEVLRRALASDPTSSAAEAELGQVLLAEGRYEEAVALLESALEKEPRADLLYYPLALAYRGLGDRERSRMVMAQRGETGLRPADPVVDALEGLTTGERVHLLRGRAAFEAESWGEAAAAFREALAAAPESVRARINLAAALSMQGDTEPAIALLEEALEIAPGNASAHFNLAELLRAGGDSETALDHLQQAVSYERQDAELRLHLADALRDRGELEAALSHYQEAIRLDPALEAAWVGGADTLARLERYGAAADLLEQGHRTMPTSGMIAHGLARFLAACPDLSLRDGERALELALRVVAALPTVLHIRTVALANAELGRCAEAAEWIDRALTAAREQGALDLATELVDPLVRYEVGPPCRPPGS